MEDRCRKESSVDDKEVTREWIIAMLKRLALKAEAKGDLSNAIRATIHLSRILGLHRKPRLHQEVLNGPSVVEPEPIVLTPTPTQTIKGIIKPFIRIASVRRKSRSSVAGLSAARLRWQPP